MRHMLAPGLVAASLASGATISHPTESPAASTVSQVIVSTVAGNGALGTGNGPAANSSFIEPDGVAVGRDRTIYVADAGAQEIRRIREGIVEFVAGTATAGRSAHELAGGYADGPARRARFNRPTGIAVAKDGTLYVADMLNHCIRRVRGGTVTTFAGSLTPGKADGIGGAAAFNFPKSIAIDDAGNLYVADYGNGIRRIAPNADVTTLPTDSPKVLAVAARGAGSELTLAYTDTKGIHFSSPAGREDVAADDQREPDGEGFKVGNAYGITIVGPDSVVVTDLMHAAIRFVRMPIVTTVMTRALAGGERDALSPVGGYQDGPAQSALVDVPLGIATAPDGAIVVADAGNRRIRRITGLDARGPVSTNDIRGLVGPAGTYRIVLIGNSYIFHNVLWPESIPGQIEAGLAADGSAFGLHRKPFVACVRLNSAGIGSEHSFITNFLSDGEADLVLLFENAIAHEYDLGARPELKVNDRWRVTVPQDLRTIEASLKRAGTKFMVVYVPSGQSLSQHEMTQFFVDLNGFVGFTEESLGFRAVDKTIEDAYASSGVKTLPLLEPMERAEAQPNRIPLYNTLDEHPSPEGQTWIGRAVVQELGRWKPWQS